MKSKSLKRIGAKRSRRRTGTMGMTLQLPLGQRQLSMLKSLSREAPSSSSTFQNIPVPESSEQQLPPKSSSAVNEVDVDGDERNFILSQDFFCTPDYLTPDNQNLLNNLESDKENTFCPRSPMKLNTTKSKRFPQDSFSSNPLSHFVSAQQQTDLELDSIDVDDIMEEKAEISGAERTGNYVSQSAVALRCRVMPPPCLKNPYLTNASETDLDPFGYQRSKCAGFFPAMIGGDGLSRYRTDFHEVQQIGVGNFSHVFKVLKRIDGCLYAVKRSTRQLHQDSDRTKALMEVQALAALGFHENIVGYYSSWFENEQLYIQLELCDNSLSNICSPIKSETEVLIMMHQIAKGLQFIHERGIAHLDVKPENIYVKNGVYKLGDFGCATRLDKSLPVEEGDARYMPQEILNENFDHLDKVDIFSLGVAAYELIRGSPLTDSGHKFINLKEGKLPLLPGHSLQFQHMLKTMMDPHPPRRPAAKELVENPIFDRIRGNSKA